MVDIIPQPTDKSFRELTKDTSMGNSTHRIHFYPAKLLPHVPNYFIKKYTSLGETVLDPFCGSGTVLLEALQNGRNAVGVEINPLAALIAKVKTTPLETDNLVICLKTIRENYNKIFFDENEIPNFDNLNYWFDSRRTYSLGKICSCIRKIEDKDIRDFFMVTFSSIIRYASKADPRNYVPVMPKKKYKPKGKLRTWQLFYDAANKNIRRMKEFVEKAATGVRVKVYCADARNLPLENESVDLFITSPPYMNAQKYVRSTRLESYWLGLSKEKQLAVNYDNIGTEYIQKKEYNNIRKTNLEELDDILEQIFQINPIRTAIVAKYFIDMRKVIKELYRVLKTGKKGVIVIGNNTVCGKKIVTNKYISELCLEAGFQIEDIWYDTISSHGLMTKRNKTANIIDKEWITVLGKD
nr:DNA methyltransferase [Candidatus Freyarchaeota archaeon]